MKVVFANPPVVRSEHSAPENNFHIDGFVLHPSYVRWRGAKLLYQLANRYFGLGRGVRVGVRAGSRWPFTMPQPMDYAPYPFVMGYAATHLKNHGFDTTILDAVAEHELSYPRFLKTLRAQRPDIVVLETSAPTLDIDLWIANQVAAFAEVALAGPHLTDGADALQKQQPGIRYLLKGEYIQSALDMAQSRRPGIYESTVVSDVDAIGFPFRDYPAATAYYDPSMPTPRPQLAVMGSKGCPFQCTFCQWPQIMYARNVTLRTPQAIAAEIRKAVAQHGFKSIFFDDDTFNMGKERISRLCDELKDIGLPWTMMGRIDISPESLYDKMVDSGCVGMRFGIETFDNEILKNVKKGIERKDFRGILEHISLRYPQIMIHLTMMKDMPGQTEAIHQNDMRILRDLGYSTTDMHRSYQLSQCAPFPGTEMHRELVAQVGPELMENLSLYDGGRDTVMKTIQITQTR